MVATAVTVGRRKYALGLEWQVSPSGQAATAAREAARQTGGMGYVVRPGNKAGRLAQFGIATTVEGMVLPSFGQPSLAATIANRQPGSWAGAFRLREGVAVLVVRDDLITPDGDQIYLDEGEARQRLIHEMSLGGLQKVYAPESWSISGGDNMSLILLLQDKAECFLQPAKIPKEWIIKGAIGLGVVALLIVGGLISQQMAEEQQRAERARLDAERQAQMAAQQQLPGQLQLQNIQYPPPRRFWEEEPAPLQLINACRAAMDQVAATYLGWNMQALSCSKTELSTSWQRNSMDYAIIIPETQPNAELQASSKAVPLSGLEKRPPEQLLEPEQLNQLILSQNWLATIGRAPDDPLPPRPPEIPPEAWQPPPAPWQKRSFDIMMPDLPGELATYFTNLPGVIIESLTYSGSNWQIKGVIYENRR